MKIRQNVYELKDETLSWYSKAVNAMKARDINDPTSWWYQAAIHGYATQGSAVDFWQQATGYPPTQQTVESGYWKRCQHGTWYFLPWHRMYLHYFEQIVAQTVVELGGPSDWALPYWNYCDGVNKGVSEEEQQQALQIPYAFGTDEGPNADFSGLWLEGRRNYVLKRRNVDPRSALNEANFTNQVGDINFGGGMTGFAHFGSQTGQLESLPHNVIHVDIGGAMADPDTAALDPIFWLHHANIDRLWQIWLEQGERTNPNINAWRDFTFKFHDADARPVFLAVKDVETTEQLGYHYSVSYPTMVGTPLRKEHAAMDVVGATQDSIKVKNTMTSASLEMVPKSFRNARLLAATNTLPDNRQSILRISNVKGKGNAAPIDVFINNTNSNDTDSEYFVGSIGLFGLSKASTPSVESDGSGLSFAIDVSETINALRSKGDWDEENITIQLVPQSKLDCDVDVYIGRMSLHSECDS